jgi:ABC-2 type transport system ATP-binding protein
MRAIEVSGLRKAYGNLEAVRGVDFTIDEGEVFGLLGPNGAGKTTTIGVLTTRVQPTSGYAAVAGVDVLKDPVRARSTLAVIPQRSNLDRALSIRNNLIFHAAYHGVPPKERNRRADELLDVFGLLDRAKQKPDMFSGGQSQRVMIARALMHAPEVLFLDEPATGLDPAAKLFVWDRLRDLRDQGVTLMLTTHDMDEAAALADRVGIMDHGKLLALDTPEALMKSVPSGTTIELTTSPRDAETAERIVAQLAALPDVEGAEKIREGELPPGMEANGNGDLRVRLYVSGEAPLLVAPAAAVLAEHGASLADVKLAAPTLEDVFIHLTGRTLR